MLRIVTTLGAMFVVAGAVLCAAAIGGAALGACDACGPLSPCVEGELDRCIGPDCNGVPACDAGDQCRVEDAATTPGSSAGDGAVTCTSDADCNGGACARANPDGSIAFCVTPASTCDGSHGLITARKANGDPVSLCADLDVKCDPQGNTCTGGAFGVPCTGCVE